MDRGREFLQTQVSNTVGQHLLFLRNLEDHEKQAEDARYRDLCSRYIPQMREHQRMLEEYASSIGAEQGSGKKALGAVLGLARGAADALRESDFLRLVGDIVMARQSQDTFTTFANVGPRIGEPRLVEMGEMMSRHHEQYVKDGNALVAEMFVDHVNNTAPGRSTPGAGASTSSR